jgi:hypothetical protein
MAVQQLSLSFDPDAMGRHQPWTAYHRGLEYRGEVIVAEAFDPDWGLRLDPELSFRLVFFTRPRRIPYQKVMDPRIAMAVPRRSVSEESAELGAELGAVHEARERYVTGEDPDRSALRRSMDDRASSLRGEMGRRYARSFSAGRSYTHRGIVGHPSEVFDEPLLESWADRMASATLLMAFPEIPIDYDRFPRILDATTVAAIFRGLFQGSAGDASAARDFGAGLGITDPESSTEFYAGDCAVLSLVRRELDRCGGNTPVTAMIETLTHDHGLTDYLALLYLLAFVKRDHAELELDEDRSLETVDGQRFEGDRLTWDLLPDVALAFDRSAGFGEIRMQSPPSWETVLPYAAILVEGLGPARDPTSVAEQESCLLERLRGMARSLDTARSAFEDFGADLDEIAGRGLEPLARLCATTSYSEFHVVVQSDFARSQALREAADLLERLEGVAAQPPAVQRTRAYLAGMRLGPEQRELSVQRDSLAALADPSGLLSDPSAWSGIEDRFRQVVTQYARTYAEHHTRYYRESVTLKNRLEEVRPQVETVAKFGQMSELGGPVGADIHERFERLTASLRTCEVAAEDLPLDQSSYCQGCGLTLDEEVPIRESDVLIGAVAEAMREYNKRLSTHAVRQIMADPSKEQVARFIDLVHAADPSSLVNVLDEQVVDFLRQFMREG